MPSKKQWFVVLLAGLFGFLSAGAGMIVNTFIGIIYALAALSFALGWNDVGLLEWFGSLSFRRH